MSKLGKEIEQFVTLSNTGHPGSGAAEALTQHRMTFSPTRMGKSLFPVFSAEIYANRAKVAAAPSRAPSLSKVKFKAKAQGRAGAAPAAAPTVRRPALLAGMLQRIAQ